MYYGRECDFTAGDSALLRNGSGQTEQTHTEQEDFSTCIQKL
jgi:hypothetical protein